MVQLLKHAEALPAKTDDTSANTNVTVTASSSIRGSASGVSAQELALTTLLEFRPFLQDIGTVHRVMDTLFRYLDLEGRWQLPALIRVRLLPCQSPARTSHTPSRLKIQAHSLRVLLQLTFHPAESNLPMLAHCLCTCPCSARVVDVHVADVSLAADPASGHPNSSPILCREFALPCG